MLPCRVPRFASTLIAFALVAALAACGGGRTVPAPVGSAQSQFPGGKPLPPPLPGPPGPMAPPAAGPVKVALLVPLSGPNAGLGKAMLEAAQLALLTTASGLLRRRHPPLAATILISSLPIWGAAITEALQPLILIGG